MESTNEVITESMLPIIQIPKNCIDVVENSFPDNMLIDVKILALDQKLCEVQIYKGSCIFTIVDSPSLTQKVENTNNSYIIIQNDEPLMLNMSEPQVWADPMSSPTYNNIDDIQFQSLEEHQTTNVTSQQHTLAPKTCKSPSSSKKFEHKKFGTVSLEDLIQKEYVLDTGYTSLGEIEYDYGPLLPNLDGSDVEQENESCTNERQDAKDKTVPGVVSEEIKAVQQLMSPDLRSNKRRRTILLLGHDEESGAKVQKITSDYDTEDYCIPPEEAANDTTKNRCIKCKKTFRDPSAFRRHIAYSNKFSKSQECLSPSKPFVCTECGKKLKSKERYEMHCLGHGDPDVECGTCRKVFSSKASLANHRKVHENKVQCNRCLNFFASRHNLDIHIIKKHNELNSIAQIQIETNDMQNKSIEESENKETADGKNIDIAGKDYGTSDLVAINNETNCKADDMARGNNDSADKTSLNDLMPVNPKIEEGNSENCSVQESTATTSQNDGDLNYQDDVDAILEKILSTGLLTMKSGKTKKSRGTPRNCTVCKKKFDRSGDLKRHLIEHVVKGTLSRVPVENGTLNITCDICRLKTFNRIDKYKVHLRDHAQLTLYKCTYCDKCFSDSSNFSKHRKIHSKKTFQCDLCSRKFNTRKTISEHLNYHAMNPPVSCEYCCEIFHFKSSLNKHVKNKHAANLKSKVRCTFCSVDLKSLKQKWDHEWTVHNMRKMAIDCNICGEKFRKYSELKRHYHDIHRQGLPLGKETFYNYHGLSRP